MDVFSVRQGSGLALTVTLADDQGNPITTYAGTETLAATVWPGGNLAASFSATASWLSASAGTISLAVSASQTSGLTEGRYFGSLALTDPVLGVLEAYKWAFDVLEAAGSGTVAPAYCAFPDLLTYGKAWLRTLQTEDEDSGFSVECGRARSWLDDCIVNAWQVTFPIGVGDPGYGAVLVGQNPGQLPSLWLRQQLDAGGLVIRDLVVEITAKKALAFIAEGQIGNASSAFDFFKLGRFYHREANELVKTLRAEINADSQGFPQFAVNLGMKSMRG